MRSLRIGSAEPSAGNIAIAGDGEEINYIDVVNPAGVLYATPSRDYFRVDFRSPPNNLLIYDYKPGQDKIILEHVPEFYYSDEPEYPYNSSYANSYREAAQDPSFGEPIDSVALFNTDAFNGWTFVSMQALTFRGSDNGLYLYEVGAVSAQDFFNQNVEMVSGDYTGPLTPTSGNDVFSIRYDAPQPSTIDGGAGIDLVTFDWTGPIFSLDLSNPALPHTIPNMPGGTTSLVNIERIAFQPSKAYWDEVIAYTWDPPSYQITGGNLADTMMGGAGSDSLEGGAGDDLLEGNGLSGQWLDYWEHPNGHDIMLFNSHDTVSGGGGNDTILGIYNNYNSDIFSGGSGRDHFVLTDPEPNIIPTIIVEAYGTPNRTDTITDFQPGPGGDVIEWSDFYRSAFYRGVLRFEQSGPDTLMQILVDESYFPLRGGVWVGDLGWVWDTLVVFKDVSVGALTGNNFSRSIDLTNMSDDVLGGGNGNDVLNGGFGNDNVSGGLGVDSLSGGQGRDTVSGGAGNDVLQGGYGDDKVYGGDGDDRLLAGFGDDVLNGGAGSDRLSGDDGRDTLYGGDGNDNLSGADGNDFLRGDAGNDTLSGGTGSDTLIGGAGTDTFKEERALWDVSDVNWIMDFKPGEDRIDLSSFDFNPDPLDWPNFALEIGDARGETWILLTDTFDISESNQPEKVGEFTIILVLSGVRIADLKESDFIF